MYSVGPMAPVESDGKKLPPSASVSPGKLTGTGGPARPALREAGERPRTSSSSLAFAARYAASSGSRAVSEMNPGPLWTDRGERAVPDDPGRRKPWLVNRAG